MRVLQIYKDYFPPVVGGIEGHLNLLAKGLRKTGIEVEILVSNTAPKLERVKSEGICVTKAPEFGRFASTPFNPTFPALLNKLSKNADLLHFHLPCPTSTISYLLSGIKKPVVATYHSDIVKQARLKKIYHPLQDVFLSRTNAIIATSPNYLVTSEVLNKFIHKCEVIPIGIDLSSYRLCPESLSDNIRKKNSNSFILFVGKFRYYKGLHILIEAMKSIDMNLVIIGSGTIEPHLTQIIRENDLTSKIEMVGQVNRSELIACLRNCRLLVLPSIFRSEAYGIVLIEAMACGKPVISTELGTGTSYVNIHQETGLVVPPNNPEKLSQAVNQLLSNDELYQKLCRNALSRANKYFGLELMIERTVNLYSRVLDINKCRQSKIAVGMEDWAFRACGNKE